jgi:hypothetical protein
MQKTLNSKPFLFLIWTLRLTPDKALPANQIDKMVNVYRTPHRDN